MIPVPLLTWHLGWGEALSTTLVMLQLFSSCMQIQYFKNFLSFSSPKLFFFSVETGVIISLISEALHQAA